MKVTKKMKVKTLWFYLIYTFLLCSIQPEMYQNYDDWQEDDEDYYYNGKEQDEDEMKMMIIKLNKVSM